MRKIIKVVLLITLSALFMVASNSWTSDVLRMSTTTSTENSGLLAVLNPAFEAKYGIKLEVMAVGTGKALKMGAQGDVDVVLFTRWVQS